MGVSLVDIRSFLTALPDVSVHDSTDDLFFFRGDEQKFPFATVVTHDDAYDALSNLDRPGVFRLNLATDKETFAALFPDLQTRAALDEANIDYQALDVLFPHPVYGRMRWVSVINPESVWDQCQELLNKAHQIRELRPNSW
ncbi:DUF6194 family protein [Devosia sp.]|uniref:DUF6194 family protein n=1 Tax=Devosia sp. TaxID=1871048 RepID=UPI001B029899|nr:DUF6194 family protein [Devosia sp.]MBO9587662.1 hypothetical protein [Devosia sp.]